MPRNTRASRRGESSQTTWEQPLVVSGDEDGEAPPGRITREAKEHLRGMQMSFTKRMYEHAKAFLQRGLRCTFVPNVLRAHAREFRER